MNNCFKLIIIVIVLTSFNSSLFSQIQSGDFEISGSFSFMSRKHETAEKAWQAFVLALRSAYFLNHQIGIEPEIIMSKLDEEKTGYIVSANLTFNYNPAKDSTRIVPFILSGVGLANTMEFVPNFAWIGYKDERKLVLNVGGGGKVFIKGPVALRFEYRYQKYFSDENIGYHILLFGFSVFI